MKFRPVHEEIVDAVGVDEGEGRPARVRGEKPDQRPPVRFDVGLRHVADRRRLSPLVDAARESEARVEEAAWVDAQVR